MRFTKQRYVTRCAAILLLGVLSGCDSARDHATINVEGSELAQQYRAALEAQDISFVEDPRGTFQIDPPHFDAAAKLLEELIRRQPASEQTSGCLQIASHGSESPRQEFASEDCPADEANE